MNHKRRLLITLAASLPISTQAKKMYKYQDASGAWHYSDRPPPDQNKANVEVKQLTVSGGGGRKVNLRQRGEKSAPVFYALNPYPAPVELEVKLTQSKNLVTQPALPARIILKPMSDLPVLRFKPASSRWGISYRYTYRYMIGDPKARHAPKTPYRPPFAPGEAYPVSQGFLGKYSHTEQGSRYALDIAMPEGSAIHAARGGLVMEVASDFYRGGTDMDKFGDRANMVRVLHDDGTMGVYAHLQLESAAVTPGLRVKAGQMLARSGNTGFSSGPHLHFSVQKNVGMSLISVPFKMLNQNAEVVPTRGMLLRA